MHHVPNVRLAPLRLLRSPLRWVVSLFALLTILIGNRELLAGDPVQALRERYLGPAGLPSAETYERALGIAPVPGGKTTDWRVVFKITYCKADLGRLDEAKAIATDCYFVRRTQYAAPFRARPVWDGRVYLENDELVVAAYSSKCEQAIGRITADGIQIDSESKRVLPDSLQLAGLHYNPFTGQLWRREPGGQIEREQLFFLPPPLLDARGVPHRPEIEIIDRGDRRFELVARVGTYSVTLAQCVVDPDRAVRRSDGFSPGLAEGCRMITTEPTVVFEVEGDILTDQVDVQRSQLMLKESVASCEPTALHVQIDGRFDDWRSVPGIADPRGDIASYLQYNPDTDLLSFKVASDSKYLYFYSRVVGRHGNTAAGRDRYYFYIYIDVDRDATTGYVPTRDDDCYYGVAIGDDCEAQFEFVGGRFVKTFFGFTGASTEEDVLAGRVAIAPSWYSKHDAQGRVRPGYKVEYIRQAGQQRITADFAEGTSDDIHIAISPDGSECEMRAELEGFLRNHDGKPVVAAGQAIDLAVGVEASGEIHGHSSWGADSTAVIRGYQIAR